MKNKIKKFAKGDFRDSRPDVVFENRQIVFSVGEGESYSGSFCLYNREEVSVRGLVYASSFRMQFPESGFEGNRVEVPFLFDGTGLKPGQIEQGVITVACNGGEYSLSFTAIIEKPFLQTKYGKIQNVRDFRNLAMRDFTEAQRIFRSRDFFEVLKYEDTRIVNLYANMRKWSLGEQALEEFLVGIKMKECLFLSLSETEYICEHLQEETKESITISKNTWGFMPIQVHTQGDFIHVQKTTLTTEEFIGNSYVYEFVLLPKNLHKGKNYGRIVFETPYERLELSIQVGQSSVERTKARELDFLVAQILKQYLICKRGDEELVVWAKKATTMLDVLKDSGRANAMYQLMQAHVYFLVGKQEEAVWVLEHYSSTRQNGGKSPIVSAYYLYLTTLQHQSSSHTRRVVDEIQKLYSRHPYSWELLCMLVNLAPEYKNLEKRLYVLERQFYNGANQIIFYLQALTCYLEKATLLKKIGSFELQVLGFAVKYRLMTKELALYVANLASQQKLFDPRLYKILEKAYKQFEEPMILTAICTLLIKGHNSDKKYFKWYQRAVKQKLKIVQLYEYYMMTIEEDKVRKALPKAIYLYFMHGNALNYKQAALLYASIVTYKEFDAELYTGYREKIVRFTWEQLEKRHISESLKVLYKKYCVEEEMNAKRIQALYDICFSYEVKTKFQSMQYVLVIEKNGEIEQRIAYVDNKAQVRLYDKEPRIVWESKSGRYYIDSIPYETKRLFYEPRLIEMCKRYINIEREESAKRNQEELNIDTLRKTTWESFDEKDVFLMCSKKIREENYEEDEFLIYLCHKLFGRGVYDKVTLTYLSTYFCGATKEMKRLWIVTQEYEVKNHKLAERIITQMLFTEQMFKEEEIFAHYYMGGAYFRLKQAYLAYVAKEYVVGNRRLDPCIFAILIKEVKEKETIADICKVATLKYYSKKEIETELEVILKGFLEELCEKQLMFPFYLKYPKEWLREVYLHDKYLVEYRSTSDTNIEIEYQISKEDQEQIEYRKEILQPVYENIYVKSFVLYENECLKYSVRELNGSLRREYGVEKHFYKCKENLSTAGIYGKLNEIARLPEVQHRNVLMEFERELQTAQAIFEIH